MNKLMAVIPALSMSAALLMTGCGSDKSAAPAADNKAGAAGAAPANAARPFSKLQTETVPAPPTKEAKEYQRVVYACGNGRELVLKLFDDQRARVEIDHETHVLRPVTTDNGTLFLGDFVNVRVIGEKATASRNGIVLMSNCQVQTTP